jgi:hypothetical protein
MLSCDRASLEQYAQFNSEVVWLVAMLFCACWRTATVPSSWRVALILPALKKGDLWRIGR